MSETNRITSPAPDIRVLTRFFALSPPLRPYFSTIYLTEIVAPPDAKIVDYLHPEWGNIRFISGERPIAAIGNAPPQTTPDFIVTGPTSQACYFAAGPMRAWGIGLLPLGWAKFIDLPAMRLADNFYAAMDNKAFAAFHPLYPLLTGADAAKPEDTADAINAFLIHMLKGAPADDPAILAAHCALVDDTFNSVSDLAATLGLSERTVQRLSQRAFGFSPKLLIRRQRFLRSLGRFMLDPSMSWINALDFHYHDQAQFTRDFCRFMGMGPREYAALPKPIMAAAAIARTAAAGAAVQALHPPEG
jgi:AraC-like DNA-binding protein